jgi:hypothetical protein
MMPHMMPKGLWQSHLTSVLSSSYVLGLFIIIEVIDVAKHLFAKLKHESRNTKSKERSHELAQAEQEILG